MKNPTFKIRIINPEDAEQIEEVRRLAWLDTYPNEKIGITKADIAERFKGNLKKISEFKKSLEERTDWEMWVAEVDGRIVGFSSGTKENNKAVFKSIYILPEFQNLGIGKALGDSVMQWIGEVAEVSVEVAAYNHNAIKFYGKFGFKKVGKEYPHITGNLNIPIIKMMLNRSRN